ncbi:MAG: HhH-GPD family protein [candidate division WWE3 bacterium GW2011_GWA1_46_21]|uniref:DNA-3-methyladenine glycosylase II n=3 Tax=Katanobacteria TaxID=422282 RepID=A0A0G1SC03_UNCKA|nr:MAG: HhH-GPD family protein [candidate division WWE3 bacterium GW2011_GWA1_46_21]KKU50344.1 MAG: HhH-GPD family protein, DNA-3-methyladenine glycosylase II [candidate division WWE3 bacterium GW2011_GWC1_47_10]KKU57124.1 MAG: HhH-GPD family protein [candidate division WWE3 bacterium GW2011_GWB1_47_11]
MQNLHFGEWFNPRKAKRGSDYFMALCREIVGQQLSGKAAGSIFKRFENLLGSKITPQNIIARKDQEMRDCGLSWAKVKYIKSLAQLVHDKVIDLEALPTLPDEDVVGELVKVKGIGPWTAEMFLIFTLNRENVFSFGDLGLKKGIEKVYSIKDPSKDKIAKIVNKWDPYKTYGSIALWHSLEVKITDYR